MSWQHNKAMVWSSLLKSKANSKAEYSDENTSGKILEQSIHQSYSPCKERDHYRNSSVLEGAVTKSWTIATAWSMISLLKLVLLRCKQLFSGSKWQSALQGHRFSMFPKDLRVQFIHWAFASLLVSPLERWAKQEIHTSPTSTYFNATGICSSSADIKGNLFPLSTLTLQ